MTCKLLASLTCPIQCRINRWGDTCKFGIWSRNESLRSGVPPFLPCKACLLLVMVGVFIVLLARNCNIKVCLHDCQKIREFIHIVKIFEANILFCFNFYFLSDSYLCSFPVPGLQFALI